MFQFFVLFVATVSVMAGTIDSDLAGTMARSTDTDLIPVFIMAHGQVDRNWVNSTTDCMNRKERQQFAVAAMQEIAETAQKGILIELNTFNSDNVTDITPLWLANSVYCRATGSVIRAITSRSDVVVVELAGNEDDHMLEPEISEQPVPGEDEKAIVPSLIQIKAPAVWALGYKGQGIIVGVIDTGVDYKHTDLKNNMWSGLGYDFADEDNDPMDTRGHGTHCAGIVAGDGSSGSQTGVAPEAEIMALRIVYPHEIIEAMEYAVKNGVDVLSLSLGTTKGNRSLRTAEENLLTAGIFKSAAAGNIKNNITTIYSPADSPPPWFHPDQRHHAGRSAVVTVGNVDDSDVIYRSSCRGPVDWWYDYMGSSKALIDPDITAPGVHIKSAQLGGGYCYKTGTSMSAPCVAGVVALMLSVDPNLSVATIDSIIETTSVDLGPRGKDNSYGAGRVDALAAVNAVIGMTNIENTENSTDAVSIRISTISPNPVSNYASFSVYAAVAGTADIAVFDVTGRRVANIDNSDVEGGANAYNWQIPAKMGSGVYFVRATVDGNTVSSRMTVAR